MAKNEYKIPYSFIQNIRYIKWQMPYYLSLLFFVINYILLFVLLNIILSRSRWQLPPELVACSRWQLPSGLRGNISGNFKGNPYVKDVEIISMLSGGKSSGTSGPGHSSSLASDAKAALPYKQGAKKYVIPRSRSSNRNGDDPGPDPVTSDSSQKNPPNYSGYHQGRRSRGPGHQKKSSK